jgi:hypothetical protein
MEVIRTVARLALLDGDVAHELLAAVGESAMPFKSMILTASALARGSGVMRIRRP